MERLTHALIICTRNRPQDLSRALASVYEQLHLPDEIIIVDSSDHDVSENFSVLHKNPDLFLSCRFIYHHMSPGLTRQRNRGARLATSAIIHFIDDDVILEKEYLSVLHETWHNHPECAGGMGAIVPEPLPASFLFYLFRTIFFLPRDHSSGLLTLSRLPTFPYGTKKFRYVETVGGCCMSFRRNIFLKEGADEILHGYCFLEDYDIAYRMGRWGKLFYQPLARLAHHNSPTARDSVRKTRAMFLRNIIYLFFKNQLTHYWWTLPFFIWSIIGLFLEALLTRNKNAWYGYIDGLKNSGDIYRMVKKSRAHNLL